jgi:hypothetical protein
MSFEGPPEVGKYRPGGGGGTIGVEEKEDKEEGEGLRPRRI